MFQHGEIIVFTENFARRMGMLMELATTHPDLRDGYLSKSQTVAHKYDIIMEESRVQAQLEALTPLFTTIENQLNKIEEGIVFIRLEALTTLFTNIVVFVSTGIFRINA